MWTHQLLIFCYSSCHPRFYDDVFFSPFLTSFFGADEEQEHVWDQWDTVKYISNECTTTLSLGVCLSVPLSERNVSVRSRVRPLRNYPFFTQLHKITTLSLFTDWNHNRHHDHHRLTIQGCIVRMIHLLTTVLFRELWNVEIGTRFRVTVPVCQNRNWTDWTCRPREKWTLWRQWTLWRP
jgi:hypothetical protein